MDISVHNMYNNYMYNIILSVCRTKHIYAYLYDSISRDERDAPLTQYITNAGIYRVRYNITHFKHYHRVLRLISNRMSV